MLLAARPAAGPPGPAKVVCNFRVCKSFCIILNSMFLFRRFRIVSRGESAAGRSCQIYIISYLYNLIYIIYIILNVLCTRGPAPRKAFNLIEFENLFFILHYNQMRVCVALTSAHMLYYHSDGSLFGRYCCDHSIAIIRNTVSLLFG